MAVSTNPYTVNGNLLLRNPVSLLCPSIEKTQLGSTDENAPLVLLFLSMGFLLSVIEVYI